MHIGAIPFPRMAEKKLKNGNKFGISGEKANQKPPEQKVKRRP
jgi:hypothetical protein